AAARQLAAALPVAIDVAAGRRSRGAESESPLKKKGPFEKHHQKAFAMTIGRLSRTVVVGSSSHLLAPSSWSVCPQIYNKALNGAEAWPILSPCLGRAFVLESRSGWCLLREQQASLPSR
ncbi:MAG: hypothetical protein ABJC51_03420, partial [Acidobacteriota bacterium]